MTDKGMQDFMELVEQMRRAQKQYFSALRGSTGQKKWLMESIRLENKVDAEIVRCRQGQMDLFGEDTCEDDDKGYPQDKYNAYAPAQNMSEILNEDTQKMSDSQKRPTDAPGCGGGETTRGEAETRRSGRIFRPGRNLE